MTGFDIGRKRAGYALFAVFALWALLVAYFFFREHPLGLKQAWRLIQNIWAPPLPSSLRKIAEALRHLLLVGVLITVGTLVGRRIMRIAGVLRSDPHSNDNEDVVELLVLALGLGWGLLMYLAFLLGVLRLLYAAAIWAALGILVLLCIRDVPALVRDVRAAFARGASGGAGTSACLAPIAVLLPFLAIIALAPTITHDAMVYHLNVPRIYAAEHRIAAVPYNLFSNTVLNIEMIYTAALLIDDFILANLTHFTMGLSAIALLYSFVRRQFGAATAALATAIFFFNPLVLKEIPIAYADMGMALYFLLALYCLWRWTEGGGRGWFALLCVCAGVFAGMKYTSLHGLVTICVLIFVAETIVKKRRLSRAVIQVAIFGVAVMLFVLPYLLKNYLITRNPVYPLMYSVFDGRWLVPQQMERMLAYVHTHGMGHDVRSMLALPWNITIRGKAGYANFDAAITPLWLIFVPIFLFLRPKPPLLKRSLILCAVYFCSWAASTHITRYLMPIFPVLSLLSAYTIVALVERARELSRPLSRVLIAGVAALCGLVWFSFAYAYPLRVPSEFGPVVWDGETREEFLARRIPNYGAFSFINENLPPDARLAFFWDNRGFFCKRPQIGDSVFEAPSMIELAHEAGDAEAFRNTLRAKGITHVLVNRLFLARFPPHTTSPDDKARLAADMTILERFLADYCVPLSTAGDVTVYALR